VHALVIAGGGVRAAFANGVLAAWEEAGWDPFDAVYGTSAGGALAAWWTAGQAGRACRTWDYVEDRRIYSWTRFLLGRGPLMDHDALFDIVYRREHPLDVEAVEAADHPVVAPVTEVGTWETHYPDIRQGPVVDWLRAAGRIPIACGPPVEIDGTEWLDGGITDALLVETALEDGADTVTLVLNRPPASRGPEPRIVRWVLNRKYPGLGDALAEHHADWNESLALARDPPDGVEAHVVAPETHLEVGRMSRDVEGARDAVRRGRRQGEDHLRREGLDPEPGGDGSLAEAA
jgi:predicted patatin/cPLA2 family phospholipase